MTFHKGSISCCLVWRRREDEVDDQRSDREEGPTGAKRARRRLGYPPPSGKRPTSCQ